jgi:hypothetical protein
LTSTAIFCDAELDFLVYVVLKSTGSGVRSLSCDILDLETIRTSPGSKVSSDLFQCITSLPVSEFGLNCAEGSRTYRDSVNWSDGRGKVEQNEM